MRKKTPRTQQQRLVALAALLARADLTWRHLTSEIAWWPAQDQERAVVLIEEQATRWPAQVRVLSPIACRQLSEGLVQPYHRLLRSLDMRLLWRFPSRRQLLARLIHEAGLRTLWSFTLRYIEGRPILDLLTRHVTGLRHLSLGSSGLDDDDLAALAQAPSLAGLRGLSLYSNRITDEGARALVSSPHLRDLQSLNLYGNDLSEVGLDLIRGAPQWAGADLILHDQRPSWRR
jgi:hypothetical protein